MHELLPAEVFRTIVNELKVGVYIVDQFRKITYWNHGAEKITGYLAQDVVGRFCRDNLLVHCDEEGRELCTDGCPLHGVMSDGVMREMQIYLKHHAGHRVPVHVRSIPLRDESGVISGAAEMFEERVEAPEFAAHDLVYAASGCLDEETGLPNRALTESYLRECLDLFSRHRIHFAVFVVRIDRFEELQARHGKDAEGAMLRAIAQTLRHALPATEFLGRWSAERFLVILPYSGQAPLEGAGQRLRQIVSCASVPWWGDHLSIRASSALTKIKSKETLETLRERIDACFAEASQPAGVQAEGAKA